MIDAIAPPSPPDSLANQASAAGLPQKILQAIKTAAARTGVDFSYLLSKASQESGFDPNAKASTSSATGLYQFTSQTWLQMVKDHGAQYGLGAYADKITIDHSGTARVNNPALRQTILGMRKDPQIAAEMAGELDKENMDSLQQNVGGKIGGTELYLAHFLGAGGASDFLKKMHVNPSASAAAVLPEAASANPAVFYSSSGQPRSLSQIYQHFAQKFDHAPTGATLVASAQIQSAPQATANTAANSFAANSIATAFQSGNTNAMSTMAGIKASGSSSLFATMVLAQMEPGMGSAASLFPASSHSINHDKKNSDKNLIASDGFSIG